MAELHIRNLPPADAARIKRAASLRSMTIARYLSCLIDLHDDIRSYADAGDAVLLKELRGLGLEPVRE